VTWQRLLARAEFWLGVTWCGGTRAGARCRRFPSRHPSRHAGL